MEIKAVKGMRCERCGKRLTDVEHSKFLELSQTDGLYYDNIPKGHLSQGAFPFGTTCATEQIKETTEILKQKISTL